MEDARTPEKSQVDIYQNSLFSTFTEIFNLHPAISDI
jgi:hypothetical protein